MSTLFVFASRFANDIFFFSFWLRFDVVLFGVELQSTNNNRYEENKMVYRGLTCRSTTSGFGIMPRVHIFLVHQIQLRYSNVPPMLLGPTRVHIGHEMTMAHWIHRHFALRCGCMCAVRWQLKLHGSIIHDVHGIYLSNRRRERDCGG